MQNIINQIQIASASFKTIIIEIMIYVLMDLTQTLISTQVALYTTKFNLAFNLKIKESILQKAAGLTLKDFEDSEMYNRIRRAQNESEGKLPAYVSLFIQIIGTTISMITYLALLILFKPWIVAIVLLVPAIKYFVLHKINIKQFKILKERTNKERKAWYYSYLITNGQNFKELKLYNLFQYFNDLYKKLKKHFNEQDYKIAKESTVKISIFTIFEQVLDGLMFAYIIYNGLTGTILIGNVITYTRAISQTKSSVQSVLQNFTDVHKESLFIDLLFDFLNMKTFNMSSSKQLIKISKIKEIRVEHLFYRYQKDSDYVLKDINMVLKQGQFYAFVGRNGSGKTTLAKILMGFYTDYEGNIFINGNNFKDVDKSDYMCKVGALFQDFAKYEATFKENIAYGNLDILQDEDKVWNISKKFHADSIINKNPEKLNTQLGYWFDNGKQISIGQWQKIALSRAFAKNADFYVLDEPNAALDAISEYDLSNLYKEVLTGHIGLVIAHRFNNFIKNADQIIVLDNGKIIDTGPHDVLVQKDGLYHTLYYLQTDK
jgi:ABC-type multidrug transport system fused ATPase/permease subunit